MNSFILLNSSVASLLPDSIYFGLCGVLSIAVLFGIHLLSKVESAKLGNQISALAVALGVVITILNYNILPQWLIYIGMAVGLIIGLVITSKIKMIQMPQMVALLNGVGGAASAIVASLAFIYPDQAVTIFGNVTAILAVAIGSITLLGSLVAAGKLHSVLTQKPVIIRGHQTISTTLLVLSAILVALSGFSEIIPATLLLIAILVVSSAFGVVFSIRVGGADMPITISLLNSLSGVAAAVAGFAIGDILLVSIGGIVGASGLFLTQIMCRAMNRSLMDILLGKTSAAGKKTKTAPVIKEDSASAEELDYVEAIRNAKTAIIVPGYGMALAQAQHLVNNLAKQMKSNGTTVKYAIHPVAGRMPGHMDVLLVEAGVPFDDVFEMDEVNGEFKDADITIVVGANDVLNPAARNAEDTPIYGMPILNVDECKRIVIFNYDLKPGYSGVENPIYSRKSGVAVVQGDAAQTLNELLGKLNAPAESKKADRVEVTGLDYVEAIKNAKTAIIVPGYGMALAQAQHLVNNLAKEMKSNGTTVKYAIHPVAGRMPGHMDVLLVEADVPFDDVFEMDEINGEFKNADVTIVVGANDVLNPAARNAEDTPIYGMPILNVDECKQIVIFNYDLNPGYSGVENPIYSRKTGVAVVQGDAAQTLNELLGKLNAPAESKKADRVEVTGLDYVEAIKNAKTAIIVPGYGMALAQAQHLVNNLAKEMKSNGTTVKYAIHPVAGRMPGHMDVLLVEADVPFDDVFEMDEINGEFKNADVTIVVGANDVLNPAARNAQDTPIYGMPILNVDECKNIVIFNYDLQPGYSGVDNPIYKRKTGVAIVQGDAAQTLTELLNKI